MIAFTEVVLRRRRTSVAVVDRRVVPTSIRGLRFAGGRGHQGRSWVGRRTWCESSTPPPGSTRGRMPAATRTRANPDALPRNGRPPLTEDSEAATISATSPIFLPSSSSLPASRRRVSNSAALPFGLTNYGTHVHHKGFVGYAKVNRASRSPGTPVPRLRHRHGASRRRETFVQWSSAAWHI